MLVSVVEGGSAESDARIEISRSPGNGEGRRLKGTGREKKKEREAKGEEGKKNSEA